MAESMFRVVSAGVAGLQACVPSMEEALDYLSGAWMHVRFEEHRGRGSLFEEVLGDLDNRLRHGSWIQEVLQCRASARYHPGP